MSVVRRNTPELTRNKMKDSAAATKRKLKKALADPEIQGTRRKQLEWKLKKIAMWEASVSGALTEEVPLPTYDDSPP